MVVRGFICTQCQGVPDKVLHAACGKVGLLHMEILKSSEVIPNTAQCFLTQH